MEDVSTVQKRKLDKARKWLWKQPDRLSFSNDDRLALRNSDTSEDPLEPTFEMTRRRDDAFNSLFETKTKKPVSSTGFLQRTKNVISVMFQLRPLDQALAEISGSSQPPIAQEFTMHESIVNHHVHAFL